MQIFHIWKWTIFNQTSCEIELDWQKDIFLEEDQICMPKWKKGKMDLPQRVDQSLVSGHPRKILRIF